MRILIITNLFPNRKEPTRAQYNRQQFRGLSKLCRLKIVAPLPFLKYSAKEVPRAETVEGIEVFHPRYLVTPKVFRSLYGFFFFFGIINTVKAIYKSFKFDLIFALWAYPDGVGSFLIARLLNKPIVIGALGSDINLYKKYPIRRKMIRYALSHSKRVFTVSNALKEQMVDMGVPAYKIDVLPNGVNTDLFRPMDKAQCRKTLNIPHDKKIILYVGNSARVKGVDLLRDAVKDLGDGYRLFIIEKKSHSEIPLWMNAADVLCLPSRQEGCPNVLLESLACETPVVATEVGGIPEIIRNNELGILVSPNSAHNIAHGIKKALNKTWDKETLRQAVLGRSWSKNAQELLKILSPKKDKLNIIYHHRTQGTGAEGVHIREIMKSLKKLGNEVYIVSPPGIDSLREERPNAGSESRLAKMWKWISGHLPEIWFELLELVYNFIGYKNIKKIIKKKKPDFIYERYAFFCFAGVSLAKKHNIPIILEVNEISGIKRMRGQVLVKLAKRIEKWIFSKADAIVTVSSFLKKQIESKGINSNKIYVIPNAVNIEKFNPDIDGIKIRNKFNLNGKTVLGFVGWFAWWDNLKLLVNTLSEMAKERANLHLVLIGDGDKRRGLEYEAIKRSVNNNITFTGKVSRQQIPNFIQAIDICVVPHSNSFGSPVVLFEYMAMSKAVVAPRLGPIEDVITDNVNGVLFEPKDGNSLRKCLFDLINNSHKRERIGKEARNTVLSKHLWRHNAERVIQIYNGVIEKCPS